MITETLINRRMIKSNKEIKKIQKKDRKDNHSWKIDRKSVLKRNIEKVVALFSEELIGTVTEKEFAEIPSISAEDLISLIDESGLTGMSGNGYPVAKKMNKYHKACADKPIKTIIVNGAECEPGLLHDAWLMRHKGKEICAGAAIIKSALKPNRMILATRGVKDYTAEINMRGLTTLKVPLKYPMGEEHFLIEQVTGLKMQKKSVPAEHGILVMNVQTVYQIGRIVNETYDRGHFVTLADLKNGKARVAYVNKEKSVADALGQAFATHNEALYAGSGIMHSYEIGKDDKFSDSVSFAAVSDKPQISNDNPCKKCGGCTKKCPMGISVREIVLAKEKDQNADISQWKTEQCIKCGTCTFFCNVGKNISAYISE